MTCATPTEFTSEETAQGTRRACHLRGDPCCVQYWVPVPSAFGLCEFFHRCRHWYRLGRSALRRQQQRILHPPAAPFAGVHISEADA